MPTWSLDVKRKPANCSQAFFHSSVDSTEVTPFSYQWKIFSASSTSICCTYRMIAAHAGFDIGNDRRNAFSFMEIALFHFHRLDPFLHRICRLQAESPEPHRQLIVNNIIRGGAVLPHAKRYDDRNDGERKQAVREKEVNECADDRHHPQKVDPIIKRLAPCCQFFRRLLQMQIREDLL